VAAGIVAAMYIVELGAGILGDPKGAEVSGVTLLMLAAMIQAFRATLKWHTLVRVPQMILATEDMTPLPAYVLAVARMCARGEPMRPGRRRVAGATRRADRAGA
jgi:hypothetical protein